MTDSDARSLLAAKAIRRDVDVAIIGAGSAGMAAYRAAKKGGADVLLIESGPYGTTCARRACMPSKLLIAAANAAAATRLLDGFGIDLPAAVSIDSARVLERVRRERDFFVDSVIEEVAAFPAADKLHGRARFLSDQILCVTRDDGAQDGAAPDATPPADVHVHARAVVIATGAAATMPPAFAALGDLAVTSDDIFDWDRLPQRIAVIGTGIIGLELGQALSRLGVKVRVFGRDGAIGGLQDPDVSACARDILGKEMAFHLHAETKVERRHGAEVNNVDDSVVVSWDDGKQQCEVDRVLVATGRRPNVDTLDLARTSLRRDSKGIPLFDPQTMQCLGEDPASATGAGSGSPQAPAIFIAGDADATRPWLNDAANEGRIAGDNAARMARGDIATAQERPTTLSIVFTEPNIACAGTRLDELDPQCIVQGAIDFRHQGRSRVMQRAHGLLHVYVDIHSGKLVGAEGIAPDGEHLMHLLAWSIQQALTVDELLAMPFYHPVIEEGVRTALRAAMHARQDAKRATAERSGTVVDLSLSDAIGT